MTVLQLVIWWVLVILLWIFQKPIVSSIRKAFTKSYQPMVFIVYVSVLGVITLSILVYTLQFLRLHLFLHFFLILILLLAFFVFLSAKELFLCLAGWVYMNINEGMIKDKVLQYENKSYTVQSVSWFSSEIVDEKNVVTVVPNSIFLQSCFISK